MSFEEQHQHVALPILVGAPAYARPTPLVAHVPRPPDIDDLPLAALQTPEERQVAESLPGHPYTSFATSGAGYSGYRPHEPVLRGRPFNLRALGRLLGGDS